MTQPHRKSYSYCLLLGNYLRRAVKDHLPGGNLPTAEFRTVTTSVPKHNKFSESIFGIFHHLSVSRPNASLLANESFVLFSLNKTFDWLESKTVEERESILKEGRRLTCRLRFKYKHRSEKIKRERLAALENAKKNRR